MQQLQNHSKYSLLLFFLLLLIPLVLFAQSETQLALVKNGAVVESLSLLSPIAISPFWTLFLTSLASTFGFGTEFISTNPLLDNYVMLVLAFILVLLTTLPNLMKVSKPIGLTATYLESKASYVIYALIVVAPYVIQMTENNESVGMVQFGLLDIPYPAYIMIALSIPYFLIVLTTTYFIEILIFLSPIPLLDAAFEIAKKVVSAILLAVYFVFPEGGLIISVLVFLVALFFYARAKRISNFYQYLYASPLYHQIFGKKADLISDKLPRKIREEFGDMSLAIPSMTGRKIHGIPKKKKVWLVKDKTGAYLVYKGFLKSNNIVPLDPAEYGELEIVPKMYHYQIRNHNNTLKIYLNRNYKAWLPEICKELSIENNINQNDKQHKTKGWKKWVGFFDVTKLLSQKDMILD